MPTLDRRDDELDLSGEFDPVTNENPNNENPDEMEEIAGNETNMVEDILGPLAALDESLDDDDDEETDADADDDSSDDIDEDGGDEKSEEESDNAKGAEPEAANQPARRNRRRNASKRDASPSANSSEAAQSRPQRRIRIDRATAARLYRENREEEQGVATAVMNFLSHVKAGRIIEGVVAGTIVENREVCWTCYFDGNITVRIPYEESYTQLLPNLMEDKSNRTLKSQNRLMSNSVGIKIPFVVESIVKDPDDGGYIAYASRRAAMHRIRGQHWGANPNRPVLAGENVYAQLIGVGPNKVWVNAFGMDIQIPKHRLSHRCIMDAAAEFSAGEEILMRVTNVVNKPGSHRVELSALPVEAAKYKGNLKRIRTHSNQSPRFGGTVTSVTRQTSRVDGMPKVVVRMWLENGVNVPAFTSTNRLYLQDKLKTGDVVLFEAHGTTENGYAFGSIIKILRRK